MNLQKLTNDELEILEGETEYICNHNHHLPHLIERGYHRLLEIKHEYQRREIR